MLVASARSIAVESYRGVSLVVSVGSHEGHDPLEYYYNPAPPVEFFARGVDVEVAWNGGGRLVCTGNSFATPHVAGIAALVLSKRPELTPFQLKSVLYLVGVQGDERRAAGRRGRRGCSAVARRSCSRSSTWPGRTKASSIFLLDEEADGLVFEGSDSLVGQRFPSSTGIAGFVLVSRPPLVIEDVLSRIRASLGRPPRAPASSPRG